VDRAQLVEFVRRRGLAVVATRGPDGAPQAALVGIAATDRGELVFDTAAGSRKVANLRAFPRVALVIGWDDEVTLQCEGHAGVVTGPERDRCLRAYVEQYPDGRERPPRTRRSCSSALLSSGDGSATIVRSHSVPTSSRSASDAPRGGLRGPLGRRRRAGAEVETAAPRREAEVTIRGFCRSVGRREKPRRQARPTRPTRRPHARVPPAAA
jgi:PPOX class probable F420-dependent enzyme